MEGIMNFQETAQRLPEYVDKCTPYVKLDKRSKQLRIALINPENIGIPILGYQAAGKLIDWANNLLATGQLVIDANGDLQIAAGADPRKLFEIALPAR
jgi:hypothetical protein